MRKLTILLIIVFTFYIVSCVTNNNTEKKSEEKKKVSQTNTQTQKNLEVKKVAKKLKTKEEIDQMYSDPMKFKGWQLDFYAKIFTEVERDDKGTYMQAWGDPKNTGKNTLIAYGDPKFDVKNGDFIHVIGTVHNKFEGKNAFGGTVVAPMILASKVEKVDYSTAISPALKTIEVNKELNQRGFHVKINKVELAKEETRVYLTVTNEMKNSKISLYSFNSKLVQGKKQLKEKHNYQANYPKIDSDLLPGISAEGVLTFTPANVKGGNLIIYLEGSCSNYRIRVKPFVFEVQNS